MLCIKTSVVRERKPDGSKTIRSVTVIVRPSKPQFVTFLFLYLCRTKCPDKDGKTRYNLKFTIFCTIISTFTDTFPKNH